MTGLVLNQSKIGPTISEWRALNFHGRQGRGWLHTGLEEEMFSTTYLSHTGLREASFWKNYSLYNDFRAYDSVTTTPNSGNTLASNSGCADPLKRKKNCMRTNLQKNVRLIEKAQSPQKPAWSQAERWSLIFNFFPVENGPVVSSQRPDCVFHHLAVLHLASYFCVFFQYLIDQFLILFDDLIEF